jgi:hypothetical protein
MTEDINYVYLCGYYSSEDYRGKHTLGIYHNEKDALNKMIQLCKSNENDVGYSWLFNDKMEQSNIDSIETYNEFNQYIEDYCLYYYDSEYVIYLYIEKVPLK